MSYSSSESSYSSSDTEARNRNASKMMRQTSYHTYESDSEASTARIKIGGSQNNVALSSMSKDDADGWQQWQQKGTSTTLVQTHIKLGDNKPQKPVLVPRVPVEKHTYKEYKPPRQPLDRLDQKRLELAILLHRNLQEQYAKRSGITQYDAYSQWTRLLQQYYDLSDGCLPPWMLVPRAMPPHYRRLFTDTSQRWEEPLDQLMTYGRLDATNKPLLQRTDNRPTRPKSAKRAKSAGGRGGRSPQRRPASATRTIADKKREMLLMIPPPGAWNPDFLLNQPYGGRYQKSKGLITASGQTILPPSVTGSVPKRSYKQSYRVYSRR